MNKFVTTALATAVAGSASFADPGNNEWLELDSEITNLARNLRPKQDGLSMAVLFRATFTYSGDNIATGPGAGLDDVTGFSLEDVDFAMWGSEENYGYRVSMDVSSTLDTAGSGSLGGSDVDITLEDGYAYWTCGEYFQATLGQFKPKVLHSGYIDPGQQLFIDRTAMGAMFDFWDTGLGASGSWEQISWAASIHNGADGHDSDQLIVLRGEMALGEAAGMGNVAAAKEGALGGSDEMTGTVGFSYYYNEMGGGAGADDVWGIFADVNGSMGPIGFAAEIGYLGDDVSAGIGGARSDWSNVAPFPGSMTAQGLNFAGNSVPWCVTGSYLLTPELEVGVRFENLDNAVGAPAATLVQLDNSILSVVANWYQADRRAKWQAQWSSFEGQGNTTDGSIFQIGLVVGGSR